MQRQGAGRPMQIHQAKIVEKITLRDSIIGGDVPNTVQPSPPCCKVQLARFDARLVTPLTGMVEPWIYS